MKVVIHPAYQHLKSFIYDLPSHFESEGTLLYRGRNVVKLYQVDGMSLVVKRYKHPNIIQRVVYTYFKRSKTARAYDYAALLRKKGIDTPHEVAYIETFKKGLFTTGYFVSLYYSYPPTSVQLDVEEFNLKFSDPLLSNVATTYPADETNQLSVGRQSGCLFRRIAQQRHLTRRFKPEQRTLLPKRGWKLPFLRHRHEPLRI